MFTKIMKVKVEAKDNGHQWSQIYELLCLNWTNDNSQRSSEVELNLLIDERPAP